MKRVLFIAYHFPPLAGGGTFRSLKFVKYLPEFSWIPTVITTKTKNYWAYDEELLDEVPPEVKIIRAAEFDPFYLQIILSKIGLGKLYEKIKDRFFIPDEKIGWIPFAYHKAVKELKSQKYDLIFSTSPTPCAHIIALKLIKRFGIPWVTDYRDLWTLNPEYPHSIESGRFKHESGKEKIIARSCDMQIHVTKGNLENTLDYYLPNRKRLRLIYNGFDTPTTTFLQKVTPNKKLTFIYTGTFYGTRNPKLLLQAISSIILEKPAFLNYLNIHFIGKSDFDILAESEKLKISNVIHHTRNMARTDIDLIYAQTDVLILIIPKNQSHILTSKIFDYLNTQKSILAIIPNGEAREILQKSNLGFFADPDSPKDIKNQILHLYHLWQTGKLVVKPNVEYIKQFHRRNLTKQLAEVFDNQISK